MNRSVCRVMVGVAGLAVLGMSATLAGAQTDQVKEKPGLYTYVSYWAFPRAHWGDIDKDNATGNQKILAPALADGTLVGYEIDREAVHNTDSRPQLVFLTPSAEHLDKLNAAIDAAVDENPLIVSALASMMVNWARVNATYK